MKEKTLSEKEIESSKRQREMIKYRLEQSQDFIKYHHKEIKKLKKELNFLNRVIKQNSEFEKWKKKH